MAFELNPLTKPDARDMAILQERALKNDIWFSNWRGTASDEDTISWLEQWHLPWFDTPVYCGFKIVESETGKMVAWGGTMVPYDPKPNENAYPGKLPTAVEGWNEPFGSVTGAFRTVTEDYGYDPKKHFHRRITMVDPDYQRKGFGRWITRAFNDLSDKANAAMYVRAMPAAAAMLQKEGYQVLETREVDFKDYEGNGSLKFTGLKREPKTSTAT